MTTKTVQLTEDEVWHLVNALVSMSNEDLGLAIECCPGVDLDVLSHRLQDLLPSNSESPSPDFDPRALMRAAKEGAKESRANMQFLKKTTKALEELAKKL